MNTKELLSLLEEHPEKSLLFEYTNGSFVGANYHITEVKNTTIDSVDCGSGTDFWKETVIQLWESPSEIGKRDFMTVGKAMAILEKVDKMKPMDRDAVVRFEYSNNSFHTAQLFVGGYQLSENQLILNLSVDPTDCKAKTVVAVGAESEACCPPESGCC